MLTYSRARTESFVSFRSQGLFSRTGFFVQCKSQQAGAINGLRLETIVVFK